MVLAVCGELSRESAIAGPPSALAMSESVNRQAISFLLNIDPPPFLEA
jgi:hypothetical protein